MAVFLIFLAIVLFVVEKYSLQYALHRVYYGCEPSQHLIDPDEPFTITSTVENQKGMMVPYVRMIENFPVDIQLDVDKKNIYQGSNEVQLSSRFYLMPKQVYTREVTATIPQRGCHYFRQAVLYGGDFLGMRDKFEVEAEIEDLTDIEADIYD